MMSFIDRLTKAISSYIYSEPTEKQIDNELKKAFGLKANISYSISNNSIAATGELSGSEKVYVDSNGMLHIVDIDTDFKIDNNYLYEVE